MIDIIQEERQPFTIQIRSNLTNDPYDLTGNSDIKVCFKTASGVTELTKSGARITVEDAKLGIISGALTQAETDAMPVENNGLIEIQLDFGGGDVRKVQVTNAFVVREKAC